jgi:hypothetical protein
MKNISLSEKTSNLNSKLGTTFDRYHLEELEKSENLINKKIKSREQKKYNEEVNQHLLSLGDDFLEYFKDKVDLSKSIIDEIKITFKRTTQKNSPENPKGIIVEASTQSGNTTYVEAGYYDYATGECYPLGSLNYLNPWGGSRYDRTTYTPEEEEHDD